MTLISIGEALWNAQREVIRQAIASGNYDGAIRIIDELEKTSRLNRQPLPKAVELYSGLAHMLQMKETAENEGREVDADLLAKIMETAAYRLGTDR